MPDVDVFDCETGELRTIQKSVPVAGPAPEDGAWQILRAERDALLVASDWTQLADTELTEAERAAWADYRQALRDLPEQTTDPLAPDWPTPPA